LAGATLNIQGNVTWSTDSTSTIDNQGTIAQTAGANPPSTSDPTTDNAGTIQVPSGTLTLQGNGAVLTGFVVAAGATLEFNGTFTFGSGTGISGAGAVEFIGGSTIFAAGVPYSVSGTTFITGGAVRFDDNASMGALDQWGGTLTGAGTVTVSGLTTWTGGTMSGPGSTVAQGGLQLGAAGGSGYESLDTRTLSNAGTATWVGTNSLYQSYGSTFINQTGATLSFQSAGTWSSDSTATFENQGTLTKVAGSGTTNLGAFLINSGSVQANAGMWQITGGGTATGSFTVAAGATLQFGGGSSFAFNSGSSVAGAGTVDFSGSYYASFASGSTYDVTGATQSDSSIVAFLAGSSVPATGAVTLDGGTVIFSTGSAIAATSLTESSGTLTGSDTINVSGLTTWTGGTMSGSGTTAAQGGLQLGASDGTSHYEYLETRTLSNAGSATWVGTESLYQSDGSTFANLATGTLNFQANGNWYDSDSTATLLNQGTLKQTAGSGTTQIEVFLNNSGSVLANVGTLEFDEGGTATGSFTVAAGATLLFSGSDKFTFGTGSSVGGAGTVTYSYGTTVPVTLINSNVSGTLTISSGSIVDFEGNVTVGALVMSGGTLTGAGTVTVTGLTTWTGGTMSGPGTIIAQGGLQLGATGSSDSESLYGRTFDNAGSATWLGSNFLYQDEGGTFVNQAGGTLDFQNDGGWSSDGTTFLINQGTLKKSGGSNTTQITPFLTNSGSVQANSGTLELNGGGTATGSFAVVGGATLQFSTYYNQRNTAFLFNAGSGVSGAGTVDFTGYYATGSSVSTSSSVFASGASYDVTGATRVDNYATVSFLAGSTVQATGTLTIDGNGGTVNFSTGSAVTVASLTVSTGYSSTLTGSDAVTVSGLTTWTNGTMSGPGTTIAQGGLQLGVASGSDYEYLYGRTLENPASGVWLGSDSLTQDDGSTFVNQAGGTIDFQSSGTWSSDGTTVLANQGTLTTTAGSNTTYLYPILNNSGSVAIQAGTLSLQGGGIVTGPITVASGTTLAIASGTYSFANTSEVSGTGLVNVSGGIVNETGTYNLIGSTQVSGGTLNFDPGSSPLDFGTLSFTGGTLNFSSGNAINLSNLTLSSGTLTGSDTVTITGLLTWTGGTMSGSGTTVAAGGLTLGAAGSTSHYEVLNARTLTNVGNATLTGPGYFDQQNASTFDNLPTGTLTIQTDSSWDDDQSNSTLENQGTLIKATTSGTSYFYVDLNNTGTVNVESGTISLGTRVSQVSGSTLTGGTWIVAAGATLSLGTSITSNAGNITLGGVGATFSAINGLTGNSGTLNILGGLTFTTVGNLANSGSLTVAAGGLLTVTGNYTQTSAGSLSAQVGGIPTSGLYTRIVSVNGTATLNGTLNISLTDGFRPLRWDIVHGPEFPLPDRDVFHGQWRHVWPVHLVQRELHFDQRRLRCPHHFTRPRNEQHHVADPGFWCCWAKHHNQLHRAKPG
jgi:hypothetical protein